MRNIFILSTSIYWPLLCDGHCVVLRVHGYTEVTELTENPREKIFVTKTVMLVFAFGCTGEWWFRTCTLIGWRLKLLALGKLLFPGSVF